MKISDCCGADATGEMVDAGICPKCKEHCDFMDDDNDMPGYNKMEQGRGYNSETGAIEKMRAAAPELLQALEKVTEMLRYVVFADETRGELTDEFKQATAAIKKATE